MAHSSFEVILVIGFNEVKIVILLPLKVKSARSQTPAWERKIFI